MSIAVKTDTGWQVLGGGGELPGLGGWATITSVWNGSGTKPNRYAYNDGPGGVGGFDWVAFEWNTAGTFTDALKTTQGLVDSLVVGGGGASTTPDGIPGNVNIGLLDLPASWHSFVIGQGQAQSSNQPGGDTSFDDIKAYGGGNYDAAGKFPASVFTPSSITGTEVKYAAGAKSMLGTPGTAGGGVGPSYPGCVIVRVPAAQAAGVDPSEYVDVP